jgi:hypothetical protein
LHQDGWGCAATRFFVSSTYHENSVLKEISEKSPEISDSSDYKTITMIRNAAKIEKSMESFLRVCVIKKA